jgi:hypothetical protein
MDDFLKILEHCTHKNCLATGEDGHALWKKNEATFKRYSLDELRKAALASYTKRYIEIHSDMSTAASMSHRHEEARSYRHMCETADILCDIEISFERLLALEHSGERFIERCTSDPLPPPPPSRPLRSAFRVGESVYINYSDTAIISSIDRSGIRLYENGGYGRKYLFSEAYLRQYNVV